MRRYDTSELFREDTVLRIRQLWAEIRSLQAEMARMITNHEHDPDCE
jgi:hypothetical protein